MKTQNLIVAIAMVTIGSSQALAFPKVSKLFARQMQSKIHRTLTSQKCEDFTGHWVGTCNANGKITNEELKAKQYDCSSITVNSESYQMGGTKTEVETADGYSISTNSNMRWKGNADTLISEGTSTLSIIQADPTNQSAPLVFKFYAEAKMQGSKLSLIYNVLGIQVDCLYDRK